MVKYEPAKYYMEVKQKEKKKVVVFAAPSDGQFQFIMPILNRLIEKKKEYLYFLAHRDDDSIKFFNDSYPLLANVVKHVDYESLKNGVIEAIDIYITSEQYTFGLENTFSVCIFHGQPSKGLTFTKEIIGSFDSFFLYGQLQLEAYNDYILEHFSKPPEHLQIYKIGYPKTDVLFSNTKLYPDIPNELGLNPNKKTILYAPAFNKYASLQENGIRIIRELCKSQKCNVIVKLPIDCFSYKKMPHEFDDVNWLEEIKKIKSNESDLFLYDKLDIYPVMVHSDIMITCVSSVGLEFMLLNKPVLFIDTPKFYTDYLKKRLPLVKDTSVLSERSYVNGGKKFGVTINSIKDLNQKVMEIFSDYHEFKEKLIGIEDYLLYNAGKATEVATDKIIELLEQNSYPKRKFEYSRYTYDFTDLIQSETTISVGLIGASKYGQNIYDLLDKSNKKVKIQCYFDNDRNKWGEKFNNIEILPLSRKEILKLDKVIITSTYWREIVEQLKGMDISMEKIVLVERY